MMPNIQKTLPIGYDETLKKLPDALRAEGFGVLTEIDVADTLKKKLNVDFRRYRILGACNPPLAHKALTAELQVGTMLPCNVVVYENPDRTATVLAIDPMQTIAAQHPALASIAEEVRAKLGRVVASL